MNASWKISLICKDLAPVSLLDSYSKERMPVIKEMLKFTTDLFMRVMTPKDGADAESSASQWAFPSALRQLGVHCRWSALVLDEFQDEEETPDGTHVEPPSTYGSESVERVHAGDRAPDAPGLIDLKSGQATRLFDVFSPAMHTVIVLKPALLQAVDKILQKYPSGVIRKVVVLEESAAGDIPDTPDFAFRDSQGHLRRAYGRAHGTGVAIVRPDGVVGGLVRGADGIESYFSRVFSD